MAGAREGWGPLVVLVLALAVSWSLYDRAIRVGGWIGWDEAYHSLWGLLIADDLVRSRFVSLLFDTYRQVYWPPLHSWYLALLYSLFGPSNALARASSLLALVGTAVVVYFAARLITGSARSGSISPGLRNRRAFESSSAAAVGGIVASACLLASSGVQNMASLAMLETPALFWLALSFWLYARCWLSDNGSSRRKHLLLGLAVLATYLTRTSYGVLLTLTLAATFLVDGQWLNRRPSSAADGDRQVGQLAARRRGQILTALVLGVPLAIWLTYPGKIGFTLLALINTPLGPERFSPEGLLFYPRSMLWLAGSWPLLLIWMLALLFTLRPGLLACNGGLRLVVIFMGLQMLLAESAVTKVERHILPMALGLSLLAGFWTGRLWVWADVGRRLSPGRCPPSMAGWVAAAGVAVLLAWQVLGAGTSAAPSLAAPRSELADYLADNLRQNGPCLLVGSHNDLKESPAGVDWYLAVEGLLPIDGAGSLVTGADLHAIHSGTSRLRQLLPVSVREQLDRWPGASGTYSAYLGLPFGAPESLMFTPSNFGERVAALLARHPVDRVLVVVREGSGLSPHFVTVQLVELGFAPAASPPHQIPGASIGIIEFKSRAVTGSQSSGEV